MNVPRIFAASTTRPNGNIYWPRVPMTGFVSAPEEDNSTGVVVLRTHDVESATLVAESLCAQYDNEIGEEEAVPAFATAGAPQLEWWTREIGGYAYNDEMPIYWEKDPSGERGIPVVVWRWTFGDE